MEWDEVVDLITGAGPAQLATASADGAPHVSHAGVGIDGDRLWFCTSATGGTGRNVAANPRVALMWSGNGAETYLWGTAEAVTDADERRRIASSGLLPYDFASFFGDPDRTDVLIARVTPERVTAMVAGPTGPRRDRWRA